MVTCEMLEPDCDQPASWRVTTPIKVVIGYYCDACVEAVQIWPGWKCERIHAEPHHRRIQQPTTLEERRDDGKRDQRLHVHR